MDQFLQNQSAIVTGGTRGIGRAIARALLQAGASVAICGRNPERVSGAVDQLRAETGSKVLGKAADVRDEGEVAGLFSMVEESFGGVDILVNSAGVGVFRPVAQLTLEDWKQTIETNLTGVFLCCQQALRRFRGRAGGFIVNLSSLAGRNAFAGGAAYNASKFALNGFSEALMLDHRYDNVRVSTIMPGSVKTEFSGPSSGPGDDWKIAPEDVAETVLAVLRMPARTLISAVEIRPAKPIRR